MPHRGSKETTMSNDSVVDVILKLKLASFKSSCYKIQQYSEKIYLVYCDGVLSRTIKQGDVYLKEKIVKERKYNQHTKSNFYHTQPTDLGILK